MGGSDCGSAMYRYKVFPEHRLVFIYFFGDYIGAEGDRAIWEVLNIEGVEVVAQIRSVIFDLRNIESITLKDTDVARVMHFEKQLLDFFEKLGQDSMSIVKNVQIYAIEPAEPRLKDLFLERLARMNISQRITLNTEVRPTLESILDDLGLPDLIHRQELISSSSGF